MRLNIGELLLKESLITSHQLEEALGHQGRHGGTLIRALVSLGLVKDRHIASLLSVHCCVPTIDIEDFEVNPAIAGILPVETARRYRALPLARLGATLAIAVADPTNTEALDAIRSLTGYKLEPFVAAESALEDAIERCYGESLPVEPLGPEPQGQSGGAASVVHSERTAWAYVTAMHAAAVGGPRTPIRGIVEDVEDMRATLIRERDEARAHVAKLEREVGRRRRWRQFWQTSCRYAGIDRMRSPLAAARQLVASAIRRPGGGDARYSCKPRGGRRRPPRREGRKRHSS